MKKLTFALYFGNRGFFPETLIAGARKELKEAVENIACSTLIMDEDATRYGAVETAEEGRKFAAFLEKNRGSYDGVILSLPNFGDENGAIAALVDCGTPILIQAYPDEIGNMDFLHRRDSFCGKFSIMDVFYQNNLPFTVFKPHTIHPKTKEFEEQLKSFASVCRVAAGMKRFNVGAIGARTTAFKTVRFDEVTLQKYDITTESLDLSEVFIRMKSAPASGEKFEKKAAMLKSYTGWCGVPEGKLETIAKLGIVFDDIISEYALDCVAIRCWVELEKEFGISPCVLLSELNNRGIQAACELDVCNAVTMRALSLASGKSSACLDWNNNYGADNDKCILFHCGQAPQDMMERKGLIIEHPMFAKSFGKGCGWGCNSGRLAAAPMTFASSKTEDGGLIFYMGEGEFTGDPIEEAFFGCAGVARIEGMQDKLLEIGKNGFRHHVSVTTGHYMESVYEAFTNYLGYDVIDI